MMQQSQRQRWDPGDEEPVGDCADAAVLYDRFGSVIFAYVRMQLASREDAEDLTLEVFTAALERDNLRGLSEEEQLAWLRRVAQNKLIDNHRRVTRHPSVAIDSLQEGLLDEEAQDPEQAALRQEEIGNLHAAIERLPEVQRRVLKLRYGSELSFADIALLLGRRESTVRKILSRAIIFLRTIYPNERSEHYGRS